jgi:hypothetical protein
LGVEKRTDTGAGTKTTILSETAMRTFNAKPRGLAVEGRLAARQPNSELFRRILDQLFSVSFIGKDRKDGVEKGIVERSGHSFAGLAAFFVKKLIGQRPARFRRYGMAYFSR